MNEIQIVSHDKFQTCTLYIKLKEKHVVVTCACTYHCLYRKISHLFIINKLVILIITVAIFTGNCHEKKYS